MATSTASAHTSLRAFQAEIDKVKSDAQKARHEHELRLAAEQAASHGKKHAPAKNTQVHGDKGARPQGKEVAKKAVVETPTSAEGSQQVEQVEHEETLEVCLFHCSSPRIALIRSSFPPVKQDILFTDLANDANPDDDPLRSKLGHVLLHNHGEYILALGSRPKAEELQGEDTEPSESTGQGRRVASQADLDKLVNRLQVNAKAVNAELSELYVTEDPVRGWRGCWMIRWTPKNAEEIVEVRVAVVGNVDAGKSTMLGRSMIAGARTAIRFLNVISMQAC